jgi:poly(ADP-ribose) glycohydrolase ARH3
MRGALLGTMVGDALGQPFEGTATGIDELAGMQTAEEDEASRARAAVGELLELFAELRYTDDTQLMIALAEALAASGDIDPDQVAERFAASFDPARGYGEGALQVLERLRAGEHWSTAARAVFPDGSYGNGAAMRVAPVGALFHDRPDRLHEAAARSAMVTHLHADGVGGAVVLAHAVSLAFSAGLQQMPLDIGLFVRALAARTLAGGFGDGLLDPLSVAAELVHRGESMAAIRDQVGNGVAAAQAVPAAIAAFLAAAGEVEATLGLALMIGGDTDTIAAMAGALAGAYCGEEALPRAALSALAAEPVGIDAVRDLADRLLEHWQRARAVGPS